jgi:hypothetical protein
MPTPPPTEGKDPASRAFVLGLFGLVTCGVTAVFGLCMSANAFFEALRRPQLTRGKGTAAIAAIAFNLCVLFVWAFAIRSLLRADVSAAEATALGDIRTVISAQAAYRDSNDGQYEPRLECLVVPATCLPDYPADGPPFLDSVLASLRTKAGYRRTFRPGPAAAPRPPRRGRPRPPGIASFAYIAVPEEPGKTGVRGFCGDSTFLICFTPDGREPGVTPDGKCDLSTCQELK